MGHKNDLIVWLQLHPAQRHIYEVGRHRCLVPQDQVQQASAFPKGIISVHAMMLQIM